MLDDATWGAFQAGWTKPVGGDADHLEELEDIDNTVAAGFAFFTLDPKAEVDPEAENADPATIKAKVEALDWPSLESDLPTFIKSYAGQRIDLRARGNRSGRGIRAAGDGEVRPVSQPMPWPCTGG